MDSQAIKLTAVGDIMLGDNHLHINRGVASTWRGLRLDNLLGNIKEKLSGEIVIGNFECSLGYKKSINPLDKIYLGTINRAKELKDIGFTHLCLANNHIMGQGINFALNTKSLFEKQGIYVCGCKNPIRQVIKNERVSIFNYSLVRDSYHNNFYKNKILKDDFAQIQAEKSDYKIVSIHWGNEYCLYPSPKQIQIAKEFIKRGVTLILGHHPHVIQGVDRIDKKLVVYSMGNFIFDQNWSEQTQAGLLIQVLFKDGNIINYNIYKTKQKSNFVPEINNHLPYKVANFNVNLYENKLNEYKDYKNKNKNWAQIEMKKEVFKNIKKVSFYTIIYPLIKRLMLLKFMLGYR